MTKPLKKWTVLLLRPDYIAENFGQDTYFTHVKASTAEGAVQAAREEVCDADDVSLTSGDDYFLLACYEGWMKSYDDGMGNVVEFEEEIDE